MKETTSEDKMANLQELIEESKRQAFGSSKTLWIVRNISLGKIQALSASGIGTIIINSIF